MAKYIEKAEDNKVCIIVGTRPGIIKMSPLISDLENRATDSFVIDAGQHYSESLSDKIFEDLRLPEPDYRVQGVKEAENHGEQTAVMLEAIERFLLNEKPEYVLVCGDANFNFAGAVAARKLRLKLGHVEAGLRSGDWRMPEEHNRVMIDHISDYLFTPTEGAKQNAEEDNVKGEVLVTGNTIVDAVQRNISIAREESTVQTNLEIDGSAYAVFTAHREENVDDRETLSELVTVLERFTDRYEMPVVYPIHPRTEKQLEAFGMRVRIDNIDGLRMTKPLGYLDFLSLLSESSITITDSGGIQEECCILGVPCVTIRENTERPETVEVGANVVAGTDSDSVLNAIESMHGKSSNWENPFGSGDASEQILNTLLNDESKATD